MTIDDICTFLADESQTQTLSRQDIDRCVLLAYDLGLAAGRSETMPQRSDPFSYTNTWLAEMGYATWRMVLRSMGISATLPATLDEVRPEVRAGWIAAAAAIRRRVANWRLPAEETELDDVQEETEKKCLDT